MVYLENWEEFAEASRNLFMQAPLRTRYVVKYRGCDQKMVLKTTNDVVCFKYKTCHHADLKKVESFTQEMLSWMAAPEAGGEISADVEMEQLATEDVKTKKKRRKG